MPVSRAYLRIHCGSQAKPQAPSIMEILPHVKRIYDRFRAHHTRVATSTSLIGQRWTIFSAGHGLWVLQRAGEEFKVERTVCSTPRLLVPGNVNRELKGPHLPRVLMTFAIGGMIGVKSKFFDLIRSTLIELTLSNLRFISVTHKYHTQAQYQLGQF